MRLRLVVLGLVVAAAPWALPIGAEAEARAAPRVAKKKDPRAAYPERVAALEKKRRGLAAAFAKAKTEKAKQKVRDRARAAVLTAIRSDILPAWDGTAWDYHGTTTTPGEGVIACGYYVTTVLRDSGFKVERAKLAQQPSERITTTLVPESEIWRFRRGDEEAVVDAIRERGDGLYVVGLDDHVGLLDVAGEQVRFCHASYAGKGEALCEDPLSSTPFESDYHVVGRLFSGRMIDAWLTGTTIETRTK
jgi:hypothetical protein